MAVNTIKYDVNGAPKRAKYRIVALGNLDNNNWNKCDTYAQVMNLIELRLLTAIAIHHRRILKSGDFKQAFCQTTLPPMSSMSCAHHLGVHSHHLIRTGFFAEHCMGSNVALVIGSTKPPPSLPPSVSNPCLMPPASSRAM